MKKFIVILLVILLFVALLPKDALCLDITASNKATIFNVPSSVKIIAEEAFAGTIVQTVVFQSQVQFIGSNAFQDADYLKIIYIPDSVVFIAESAFPKNDGLTIHGVKGSYVQKWAEENSFDYVVDDIWTDTQTTEGIHVENLLCLFWIICPADENAFIRFFERIKRFIKSMRPQDRPELYPINYRFP